MRKREPLPLGDGSPHDVARLLGLSEVRFAELRARLTRRGFPLPDQDTGLFDLDAVNVWRRRRNPHLFTDQQEGALTPRSVARDAAGVVEQRLGAVRNGQSGDPVLRR